MNTTRQREEQKITKKKKKKEKEKKLKGCMLFEHKKKITPYLNRSKGLSLRRWGLTMDVVREKGGNFFLNFGT